MAGTSCCRAASCGSCGPPPAKVPHGDEANAAPHNMLGRLGTRLGEWRCPAAPWCAAFVQCSSMAAACAAAWAFPAAALGPASALFCNACASGKRQEVNRSTKLEPEPPRYFLAAHLKQYASYFQHSFSIAEPRLSMRSNGDAAAGMQQCILSVTRTVKTRG